MFTAGHVGHERADAFRKGTSIHASVPARLEAGTTREQGSVARRGPRPQGQPVATGFSYERVRGILHTEGT
jgi:hypothetical protein